MLHHERSRERSREPRNRQNPWPEGTRERALALIREGKTSAAVGAEIGVPPATVRYWRLEAGIAGHTQAEGRRQYIRANVHEKTDRELGVALGISHRTVTGIRKRLGLAAFVTPRRTLGVEDYDVIALLASKGYTQLEIGTLMGVHQTLVSRFEDEWKIKPCARELKPVRSWATVRVVIE